MKKHHSIVLGLAFLGVFLSGFLVSHYLAPKQETASGRRILYYVDPMNPSNTSDKPGLAPCGMKMEPVYADDGGPGQASGIGGSLMPSGTVRIGPEKQQLIGVRVEQARVSGGARGIRALGRVAADENRVAKLTAGREGYMGEVKDALPTGSLVRKDQLLASYYSIDSLAAQQSYLFALNAMGQGEREISLNEQYSGIGATAAGPASLSAKLMNAEENLKLYGMGEGQIREIARTRRLSNYIELRAPFSGLIVYRNLFPYSRFPKDAEFYRILDLTEVWIYADLYADDEPFIKPGTVARITLPGHDGEFQGKVSNTLPQFDGLSRVYKVRLDVPNPGLVLRPDAFVDVDFSVPLQPALNIPAEAVLDSGLKKTVFVDLGNGFFEPRSVETGWSAAGRVQITGGLMPGEMVVTSGQFLIDSESRMKLAATGASGPATRDPVCRMEIPRKNAEASGLVSEFEGATYYFCSPECKKEFDKDPGHFATHGRKGDSKEMAPPHHSGQSDAPAQAKGSAASMPPMPPESNRMTGGSHAGPMASPDPTHQTVPPAGMTHMESKEMHWDPVCGEEVDRTAAEAAGNTSELHGSTYYFSSGPCKQVFDLHPERFLERMSPKPPQQPSMPAAAHPSHDMDAPGEMKQ